MGGRWVVIHQMENLSGVFSHADIMPVIITHHVILSFTPVLIGYTDDYVID